MPVNIIGFGGHHPPETPVTFRRNTHPWTFSSFQWRLWALMELVAENKLGAFVRESPDSPGSRDMHPAVLEVAGRLMLTKQGHFRTSEFLRDLKVLTTAGD